MAFLRRDMAARDSLEALEGDSSQLTTTPVNAFELFLGAWRSSRRESNMLKIMGLLDRLKMLDLDSEAAYEASRVADALYRAGAPIGLQDTLVAGIALRHGEALVTRNVGHFGRVTGLRVEPW